MTSVIGNLFIWVLADFRNTLMTALAVSESLKSTRIELKKTSEFQVI